MFAGADQATLFGGGEPGIDASFSGVERSDLTAGAWVDHVPMWLSGDAALHDFLVAEAEWSQPVVRMYDRDVQTPRLVASLEVDVHPVVLEASRVLSDRYGAQLDRVSAGWYRNGSDSVAWHGDRVARDRPEATVATVSLRGPRRFVMKPKEGEDRLTWSLGHGDLIVMGGSAQRTWRHAVPKVAQAPPRMAIMFRHRYD